MTKDCPRCRLVNPPTADVCDCGYDFATRAVCPEADPCRQTAPAEPAARVVGYALVFVAAGLLAAAVAVAVPWLTPSKEAVYCGTGWAIVFAFGVAHIGTLLVMATLALLCGVLLLRH